MNLAAEFLQRSFADDEPFFYIWTAMEILCGKANAIRNALKLHYELKHLKEVDDLFGFKVIAKWRHDYMHFGKRPPSSGDVEKFMRSMALELIRWKLKLPRLSLLSHISSAVGYDLSAIGLADRRTEEQKGAASKISSPY